MALPLPTGLTPAEVAFLCELELITIIPRQRLDALQLLGGPVPALQPPIRNNVPLWLALLLKKQRRANIVAPPWLTTESLSIILKIETEQSPNAFSPQPRLPTNNSATAFVTSPPFLQSSTSGAQKNALPYHWLEMGEILLEAASDDFEDANQIRTLLRDLREARLAKLRSGTEVLHAGGGLKMNGVGGMELAESRAFISGVIDGLRKISATRDYERGEGDVPESSGLSGTAGYDDDDMLQ